MGIIYVKDLDDEITFGKYNGKTIRYVLSKDPSYLVWAHDTIGWFKVLKEIYDEAVKNAYEEKINYYAETLDWGIDMYDFMD